MSKDFIALIPAYKPKELLIDLLIELTENNFKILVVDDGSGDEFAPVFEKARGFATVIKHEVNMGKGRALKTGYSYIENNYPTDSIIVTMDADGQHRTEDAIRLCNASSENKGALILGSRKLQENVPLRSQFGNTLTRLVYHLSTGTKVHDTQTGLRAFCAQHIPFMNSIGGDRYEYEINVLLECSREGIPIIEMEIPTIYLDNNSASHFNALRDSIRIYKEILKFSASSVISFLVDFLVYTGLLILTAGLNPALSLRMSNIGARAISSILNFTINRKLVFKSKDNLLRSAIKYFSLVIVIVLCSTFVLAFFVEDCHFNLLLAKIITEIIFFTLSWFVQHFLVFKKKSK